MIGINTCITKSSNFDKLNFIKTEQLAMVPKFLQLVEIIKSDIDCGIFKIGEQIPSIHETSIEFDMAKQTVERAYKILKNTGHLCSVKGKGFFVANKCKLDLKKVVIFVRNYANENFEYYKALKKHLPKRYVIDIKPYGDEENGLEWNLITYLNNYDFFVIFNDFIPLTKNEIQILKEIPEQKLIIVGNTHHIEKGSKINCDPKNCIKKLLKKVESSNKWNNYLLILSKKVDYKEISSSLRAFCASRGKYHASYDFVPSAALKKNTVVFVTEDDHLVQLIRECNKANLIIGLDVGVVCYHDSALKEIISGGISSFTPNYEQMGMETSEVIVQNKIRQSRCDYMIINRNSLIY